MKILDKARLQECGVPYLLFYFILFYFLSHSFWGVRLEMLLHATKASCSSFVNFHSLSILPPREEVNIDVGLESMGKYAKCKGSNCGVVPLSLTVFPFYNRLPSPTSTESKHAQQQPCLPHPGKYRKPMEILQTRMPRFRNTPGARCLPSRTEVMHPLLSWASSPLFWRAASRLCWLFFSGICLMHLQILEQGIQMVVSCAQM